MALDPASDLPDLLVSAPNGGGLAVVHRGEAVVLDRFPSTGLWVEGDRINRAVMRENGAEIWIYHQLVPWRRIEQAGVSDLHDVRVADGRLTLISTGTNELAQYSPDAQQISKVKLPGEGDAWHLNSFCAFQNDLLLSAFGSFPTERGWAGKTSGAGLILNLRTGLPFLQGLSQPHSLEVIDGQLYLCNSQAQALLRLNPDGTIAESWTFDGYTRGLAATDRWLFLGQSQDRHPSASTPPSNKTARILVLDRSTMMETAALPVPFREIYDIRAIPPWWFEDLVSGQSEVSIITP